MSKKGYVDYFLSPKILMAIIVGMALLITAILVAFVNMANNDKDFETASVSSEVQTSSEASSVTSSLESTSSVISSEESSSNLSSENTSSKNTSSIKQVTSVSLPVADDNPFGVDKTGGDLVCYLTFDDGPCNYTDDILKILKKEDVKATFFVVGTMSTKRITDIYNDGHAIGLHTGTHDLNKIYKDADSFLKDLTSISDTVYNKTGIRSNLTRFPGGSTTAYSKLGKSDFETVKETIKEAGYTYFDWNIDSGDTHKKSPSEEYVINQIRKNLKSSGELKSEVCILMHDIKNVTNKILPDLIKELKSLGYTFKTLDSKSSTFSFK